MENSQLPNDFLNFEGPENETLFTKLLIWCLPTEWFQTVQREIDAAFSQLSEIDDRSLAVVGALILENAVDELLDAHIPSYKNIQDNANFSFSMKINLARSLRLCPTRLFRAIDAVRQIRNDFAHSLSISSFLECKPEHIRSVKGHLQQINPGLANVELSSEQFKNLVSLVFLSLRGYRHHVHRLNEFVRNSDEFRMHFKQFCEATYEQPQRGVHFE